MRKRTDIKIGIHLRHVHAVKVIGQIYRTDLENLKKDQQTIHMTRHYFDPLEFKSEYDAHVIAFVIINRDNSEYTMSNVQTRIIIFRTDPLFMYLK